jgi:hypothetical protein
MEPRQPKRHGPKKSNSEPPLEVEGGEMDQATPEAPTESGMIGEGGRSGGGAAVESDRDGGMIGQG